MNLQYMQSNLQITPDGLNALIWFDINTKPYQVNNQQQRVKWKHLLDAAVIDYESALRRKFMMAPWRVIKGKIQHDKSRCVYYRRMIFYFESRYPRHTPMDWCYTPETPQVSTCLL